MDFEYDPIKSSANAEKHGINFEERFEVGEPVLDYFETDVVLNIHRLAELSNILNLSALAREAGLNVQTLQSKIRRKSPLTAEETRRIVKVLKQHHLSTVA